MPVARVAITRRELLALLVASGGASLRRACAFERDSIALQPYFAGVGRAIKRLEVLGSPLAAADAKRIAFHAKAGDQEAVRATSRILDAYTLATLSLHDDGSLNIGVGGAPRILVEQGWQMFLIKVENEAGVPCDISFEAAENSATPSRMVYGDGHTSAQRTFLLDTLNNAPLIEKMWVLTQLDGATSRLLYESAVSVIPLSGFQIEYHVMQLFSRDRGQRSADLVFAAVAKDVPSRVSARKKFDFSCRASRDVPLRIRDASGRGCMASLTIRDGAGRIYPPQAMRLAPDMSFHRHVYRADGETVRLPDGDYTLESRRGPEYLLGVQSITVGPDSGRIEVDMKRWIDPARWGWYSGDTHIHAAGCAHYQHPTEGVSPETVIRHVRGEGLAVGDVLTWGPSWYYQKQFFTGRAASPAADLEHAKLQFANNANWQPRPTAMDNESLLRYDVEVSGFPSSMCGHLVLLRLKEQDYPHTKFIEEWPSWNLPILRWAREQGAVAGYAHCGMGMRVDSADLPNYDIPPFDSIGTNEAIVDVTHGLTDFLSGCEMSPITELNAWYHLLNCGFRLSMLGETDYPCLSSERPGVGRSYVWLERRPVDDAGYDAWIRGLQQGRLYCGDGRSHFLEFKVHGRRSGEGEVLLNAPGQILVHATVAARLEPRATPETDMMHLAFPSWHLERARIGQTREIAVELVVNGLPVGREAIIADGTPRMIRFKAAILRNSWVALRILPSAHTHPVFVQVDKKPIRVSRRSAQWCRACVDKLWEVKSPFMRDSERPVAAQAFDHARRTYDAIATDCELE